MDNYSHLLRQGNKDFNYNHNFSYFQFFSSLIVLQQCFNSCWLTRHSKEFLWTLENTKSSLSSNANLSNQDCVKYFLPTISLTNIIVSHYVINKLCFRYRADWRRCAIISPYWLQYWRHGSEMKAPKRLSHIAVGDSRNLYLITCLWSGKCSLALTKKNLLLDRCTWISLWHQSIAVICKIRGKLQRKKPTHKRFLVTSAWSL